jgi:hypothetical protein
MKEIKIVSSAMSIFVIAGLLWLTVAKDYPAAYEFTGIVIF